eukprot:6264099-Prymnesium_polylepis.1
MPWRVPPSSTLDTSISSGEGSPTSLGRLLRSVCRLLRMPEASVAASRRLLAGALVRRLVAGSFCSPLHTTFRSVIWAMPSTISFREAMTSSSPACGFQKSFLGDALNFSSVATSAVCSIARSVVCISLCSTGMPSGLSLVMVLSKSFANSSCSSISKPRPLTFTRMTGTCFLCACRISRKHHGRVSTPLVPRSTMMSESSTPSRSNSRRSAREELSRNTGQRSILRRTSWRKRASLAASTL